MSETLQAESITKQFPTSGGTLTVLGEVSFTMSRGESAAVMGPSGSGKSTLLNILGALEPPSSGRVTLGDRDPWKLAETELAAFRNRSVGFVFQDHHLLPQCSVLENVLIPTMAGGRRDSVETGERASTLLDRVGLADRLDHRPAELSGGERQRVALARALINRPLLLLADEPTGNLDRATALAVCSLMLELHGREKTILLVATHSESLARRFARRFELSDGRLREC